MVIEFQGPAADGWRASLILQQEGLAEADRDVKPRRSMEELHALLCEYPRCKGWEFHQQRYGPLT